MFIIPLNRMWGYKEVCEILAKIADCLSYKAFYLKKNIEKATDCTNCIKSKRDAIELFERKWQNKR